MLSISTSIVFTMGWILGIFTAMLLVGWLDEREDGYVGITYNIIPELSTQYQQRVLLTQPAISTKCAYCGIKTNSIWCDVCKVYYCLSHNVKAHKGCHNI